MSDSNVQTTKRSNSHVPMALKVLDELRMTLRGTPVCIATMNDEVYLHCSARSEFINVYKRNNLQEINAIIREPELKVCPRAIAGCSLSNCIYVLGTRKTSSILRITKGDEQQFNISPWIRDLPPQNGFISVSATGSIIVTRTERPDEVVSIYSSDGSLLRQMTLSLNLDRVSNIIPKSCGNLVLVTYNYEFKRKLTEINMDGNIVRQYQSALLGNNVAPADSDDRILIVDRNNSLELLDPELNLLDVTLPGERDNIWAYPRILHYNRLRNEILMIDHVDMFGAKCALSIFTFREEK